MRHPHYKLQNFPLIAYINTNSISKFNSLIVHYLLQTTIFGEQKQQSKSTFWRHSNYSLCEIRNKIKSLFYEKQKQKLHGKYNFSFI